MALLKIDPNWPEEPVQIPVQAVLVPESHRLPGRRGKGRPSKPQPMVQLRREPPAAPVVHDPKPVPPPSPLTRPAPQRVIPSGKTRTKPHVGSHEVPDLHAWPPRVTQGYEGIQWRHAESRFWETYGHLLTPEMPAEIPAQSRVQLLVQYLWLVAIPLTAWAVLRIATAP